MPRWVLFAILSASGTIYQIIQITETQWNKIIKEIITTFCGISISLSH